MDLAGALLGLVLGLPVLLVAGLLVWWEDGRPVLFVQPRVGREGRLFPCLKLRTMRRGASDQPGPVPAPASDPRHLRCGRLLRRWAVDEIPQLLNVLRGEMSLVGPRPLMMEYLPRYSREQARRHDVRPGITGLAQVNGRNAISWDEKFAYDLDYVDRLSFALDAKILAATAWKVLRAADVNATADLTMPEFLGTSAPESREG